MGTSLYVKNESSSDIAVKIINQGPSDVYNEKFVAKNSTIPAGKEVEIVEVIRGLTYHFRYPIDTTELQLSIDGHFIGAVVIMLSWRGEPVKSEIKWALRGASSDITEFADDDVPRHISYRTSRHQVSASIVGESHGLGLYDAKVAISATPLGQQSDITIDINLQDSPFRKPCYSISIENGFFEEIESGTKTTIRKTVIANDGVTLHAKAFCAAGARIRAYTDEGVLFDVPLNGLSGESLNLSLYSRLAPNATTEIESEEIPFTLISPAGTAPTSIGNLRILSGTDGDGESQESEIDLNNPEQRSTALNLFGGALAYITEHRRYIWNSFNLWNSGELVRVNLRRTRGGSVRAYFSGFHRNNPVFTAGGFGTSSTRFVALMNGVGSFPGAVRAIQTGLLPHVSSIALMSAPTAYELISDWQTGSEVNYSRAATNLAASYGSYQLGNMASIFFMSSFLSRLVTPIGSNRPNRVSLLYLLGIQFGVQQTFSWALDSFTNRQSNNDKK
ncbi:hypothetical protein [Burkholderia sp. BCC0398]|uniref:hypothetical protein n=1 Tax=Burkholderia sp. BCC0398 TaxID=2676297 RepID=UPI00158E9D29|nr:hypothetical protein [Burkholderia sp. BCC0398]